MGRGRSSGAKLWAVLNKSAARNARRMQRVVAKSVARPMTDAIVRNAVRQSTAMTRAAQRALSGVVSPALAPGGRGSGRWEEGVWGPGLLAQRRYRIFIPSGVTASRPAPMLVLLHGCGQDSASFAATTRAAAAARVARCVVLMPEQPVQANAQRCWNWFRPAAQGGGETALLMAMIDHVCQRYPIRSGRVSALGLSAGGAMALMLGLHYPERFVAVGSHSGAVPYSATNAAQAARAMRGRRPDAQALTTLRLLLAGRRPPPLLLLHGDADAVVGFGNATAAASLWLDLQPPGAPAPSALPSRRVQRGARRAVDVIDWMADGLPYIRLVRIDGLGHAWSGGSAGQAFSDPSGPDALKIALRFFSVNGLGID
jgi:poly(3-hydroxybutyrate) depolymerase